MGCGSSTDIAENKFNDQGMGYHNGQPSIEDIDLNSGFNESAQDHAARLEAAQAQLRASKLTQDRKELVAQQNYQKAVADSARRNAEQAERDRINKKYQAEIAAKKAKQNQTGGYQYGGDQYGGDQYGGYQYGGDQYGGYQYGGDQYGGDQYGGYQYGGDQYGGDQYGGYQYGGEPGDIIIAGMTLNTVNLLWIICILLLIVYLYQYSVRDGLFDSKRLQAKLY
jgi:hypothetical protein